MRLISWLKKNNFKPGQSLLEVTMAIGILMLGLLGVMALTSSSYSASSESQDRIVAVNLAREGVEAVRSIRDNSWLFGGTSGWYQTLSSGGDVTAIPVLDPVTLAWSVDFGANSLSDAGSVVWRDQNSLYRQSASGVSGASATLYSRLLTLYPICRDSFTNTEVSDQATCATGLTQVGVRVVVSVSWLRHGSHQVTLEDFLYNWRYAPAT